MRTVPALLLTLPLAAQAAPQARTRTLEGLRALNVGRWEDALRSWAREGYLSADELARLLDRLQGLIPGSRSVGGWAPFREPLVTDLWERHFITATFDEGGIFLVFDWIRHKDHWRLQRLQVVQDPAPFLRIEAPPSAADPR